MTLASAEIGMPSQPGEGGDTWATALGADLRARERDLAAALSEAVDAFGSGALGAYDLPALDLGGQVSPGELRAVAVLWFCKEYDDAGVPALVEELAARVATGRLVLPGARDLTSLMRYHRARHERHSAAERRAIYSRLFGGVGSPAPNAAFDGAWRAYVSALAAVGRTGLPAPTHLEARLAVSASTLAGTFSGRAAGATRFQADRCLAHLREALALLKQPELRSALGPRSPAAILRSLAPQLLGHAVDPTAATTRARVGAELLGWLADNLVSARAGRVATGPGARAAVDAAALWEALS